MDVIIPLAGHSRRFKAAGYLGPKALLMAGKKTILEHVVSMFDGHDCVFHFIINEYQKYEVPNICEYLKEITPRSTVTVINPHEVGPVFTALAAPLASEDKPIVISYCDFTVEWDFQKFLNSAQEYDGAIAAFKGFHPASFGTTYFAYMKVSETSELQELREKESFTDDRVAEPASAGIYYFKNFSIFKKYGNLLLSKNTLELPEAYVSLLFNEMIKDGLRVSVPYVRKFICLGTPEDLHQYNYWHAYFNHKKELLPKMTTCTESWAVIPMAGEGRRFKEYGYRVPKPLITVRGKPMISSAFRSLPSVDNKILLARSLDVNRHNLRTSFSFIDQKIKIIEVDYKTSGQAATCLICKDDIPKNDQVYISSCDYEVSFNKEAWQSILDDDAVDAAIWVYRLRGLPVKNYSAFGYCSAENKGVKVQKIVEKKTISKTPERDLMIIGTFWFRKAKTFFGLTEQIVNEDITVNGEHYIANGINLLLERGLNIVAFEVDSWVSFGDPFELSMMEYWEEYFANLEN